MASDNDKFSVTGVPAEGSGNSWASWGGFNSNSNHTVDGTVTVTYGGTDLIANCNVVCGTLDAESKSVAVSYRSDVYVVGKYGNEAWNFGDSSNPMTYNSTDKTYTGTITVPADSYILFARKTGETYDWNLYPTYNGGNRLFFGAKTGSDGDSWWYGDKTGDDLVTNPSDVGQTKYSPIYFQNAGTYTITIDAEAKTFSIASTNVANIAEAQAFDGRFTFTGNVVVTYHNKDQNNVYYTWIRDVENRDGEVNSGLIKGDVNDFTNGDVLKAGWKANKNEETTGIIDFINPEGLSFKENNTDAAAPYVLSAFTDADLNKYVSMSGVTVTNVSGWKYTVTIDGTNTFDIYDQFHLYPDKLVNGKTYNVTGVVSKYGYSNNPPQLWLIEAVEVAKVETPTFTPAAGTYYEAQSVIIACETPEAVIRYTTDGTDPTATSAVYSAAIPVNATTTIKAIAMKEDYLNSSIAEAVYTIKDPSSLTKYTKVTNTADLTNGNYLIVYEDGNVAFDGSRETLDGSKNTFEVEVSSENGTNIIYTDVDGYFTFDVNAQTLKSASGFYIGQTSYNNGLKQTNDEDNPYTNTITIDGSGDAIITAIDSNEGNKMTTLRYNKASGDERFRYYKSGQQPIQIYKSAAEPEPLAVTLPDAPAEPYKVGQEVKVKATVENGSETTQLTYKVGEETLTIDNEGNVTLPNKKAGNVVLTVTAVDGDQEANDTKTYVFDAADALTITLTPATGTYTVGDEQNVTVTVEGAIDANPTITYKFGEEGDVQNYDAQTGIVLPTTQAGTVNLTVMVDDNGYEHTGANENGISTATGTYTVNNKPLTVTLDPATKTYVVGQEAKVKVTVENAVGEVAATYKVGESGTEKDVPEDGYIILDNDKAVENMTVTVTAVDDREPIATATGTYTFTAAPTIGITLTATPAQETYTVGDKVNVKVATTNTIGEIGENVLITYATNFTREGEQTYTEDGINITSNEAGTVTLTVNVLDGYEHEGAVNGITTKTAEYEFVKAGAITITFDPASGAEFNVGDPNAKVKVTIAGAADGYLAEYTVGNETGDVPEDGIITLPNAAAGNVTLEVTVEDGLEHEGETTASATYKFNKLPAGLSFSTSEASATVGSAFTAPTLSNEAGLTVTYESSNENVATVAADGTVTIVGEGTTIITATFAGNDTYEGGSASYTLTVAPQPVVATPVITPNGGSYSEAPVEVTITCDTPEAVISYSTNGTTWTEGTSLSVSNNCTVYAKATKANCIDSDVAQAVFKFEIPEEPNGPVLKGYYQIKNNGNGEYANVLGRKTLRFTGTPDAEAGTVIYVETSDKGDGQVQSLRSQAADLQGYANRAMRYVPEVVQLVVNKLNAVGPGEELGTTGYDAIMTAFNESFDYHLYVEPTTTADVYRLYGKTPSMQPVVDFYREHKDKVEAKVPMIEGFVNEAIQKILQKTNGSGASILVPYSILEVWENMGGEESGITKPVTGDNDAILNFYRDILNDKDNVWNFAYQSVMIYWSKLKDHPKFDELKPQLGEFANYIDKLEQIRPNAKYYVVQTGNEPDYVSDGNELILNNDDCTYWTLEPRDKFTVNFPADNKYGDQYVTTLYTDFAYQLPEDVTAYKVTEIDNNGIAKIEALTAPIAAQTPVLLMAKATRDTKPKVLTIAESGNAVDGNLLVGPEFLIERDSILTPQVAAVFALAKKYVSDDFYNTYVKEYEHLMFRNSGTVNNKYFWGLSLDDLKTYCSYENDEGMKDCDVRSLGVEEGKIAFNEHFTVATNKAFLINKDFDVINLALVETPVITPEPQNPYTEPVEVTITCGTEGATILYTTDGGNTWTEYEEPFTLSETTTVQAYATMAGLGDSEKTEEVKYIIELPVATPVVTPEGGSYGSAQTVEITCDTPDAVISYSTDGGEHWTVYEEPFIVNEDCTITVKAEKDGMTPSETSVSYVFEIPENPINMDALKGYFYIKNNESENCFANVLGRKTLHFTNAPEDQAGTVFYLETDIHGQVQSLRSQAADFQGYADRAMNYVPKVVQIVVDKLHAAGSGALLGTTGYEEIMEAFNNSFDHHLYVEPVDNRDGSVYRLYAKTPSMQPVVDFYRSHKDKVDAKLPMLEGFINTALHKVLEKTDGVGASILVDYDIHDVWTAMGGVSSGLTEPTDSVSDLAFYQEVLNNKDNVWNFAYQSVMLYWNRLMQNTTFQEQILPQLGSDAQYLENLTQIRPNTKYYVIKNGDELDYVSEGHVYITGKDPKTYWTLEPRTTFVVNVPTSFPYRTQYVTTLYTDFAYSLPGDVTAVKVTSISDNGVINTEALTSPIAAQTPVMLMTTNAGPKTLTIEPSGNAVDGNLLVGPDFLIERDSILTPQVAALFSMAKYFLNEEFYEANVKQYEHLMFRTAGTVNNKYFWGLSFDDLKTYCSFQNEDGEKETDIRSLGLKKGSAAFCEMWTVDANKAFLIDETKEFDALLLPVKDITRDGKWDISDATALIDILLTLPARPYDPEWDYEAADFDLSGEIDITDATELINYLLYK
ncbi:MAG: chitobiase/beta-hexosaminidase C-terminal domain-containing protein [Muribaculaceae bacterium]|nr:chitobiase/beta-hexosaminidase C-terminal domain-containing protein [Muribaculaceae bacterium]